MRERERKRERETEREWMREKHQQKIIEAFWPFLLDFESKLFKVQKPYQGLKTTASCLINCKNMSEREREREKQQQKVTYWPIVLDAVSKNHHLTT